MNSGLFDHSQHPTTPLAHRMRPQTVAEFCGQGHLVAAGNLLTRVAGARRLPHFVLWGPPGTGKTTLAHLMARARKASFVSLSAVLCGVPELREACKAAQAQRQAGVETVLFVDEMHRLNKAQQDALLPYLEDGTVSMIGATTENPTFALNRALLSRVRVLALEPLDQQALETLVLRALCDPVRGLGLRADVLAPGALETLVHVARGDARVALNILEMVVWELDGAPGGIDSERVRAAAQVSSGHDRGGDGHYELASALIKSLRASDVDAALYWLSRMLDGEDPAFLARRLVIFASEDIGNADPQALVLAVAAMQGVQSVGMPEARYLFWQLVVYLARAPKSAADQTAGKRAARYALANPIAPVPLHLRPGVSWSSASEQGETEYKNPHTDPEGARAQSMWPLGLTRETFYDGTSP